MSGSTGGSFKAHHDFSNLNMPQYIQKSLTSRETMDYKLDGPSSTLHMATDVYNKQLALASRTVFKIFNIKDNDIINGIQNISLKGRLEEIKSGKLKTIAGNNRLIVDGGHNISASLSIANLSLIHI